MKILLGTNTFGNYKRQDIAVQSWKKLKEIFPDTVELMNIQFEDEMESFNDPYGIPVKYVLKRSSLNLVPNATKKLPLVNDIFAYLCAYSSDYFIFTNSDVIINKNLITYIMEKQPECFACSRLDIQEIDDFSELRTKAVPVRWEIAGFDTFVFKKSWFLENQKLFNDYLLGKPEFDHVYAGIIKCFGDNTPLGNQYPPFCFHIHHGLSSVTTECPEREFNEKTMKTNPLDTFASRVVYFNLKYNLLQRKPWGSFLQYDVQEREREKRIFSAFNVHEKVNLMEQHD